MAARLGAMPIDASGSEADWVGESFEEAKRSVYVSPVGVGPFTLDDATRPMPSKSPRNGLPSRVPGWRRC
jgi:hypothetical protein